MDPAVGMSQVEMNVLKKDAQRSHRAQVGPNTHAQPQAAQESNGIAPQDCDSPDPARPATERIFQQPNLEDVLREISDSCTPEETAEAWSKTATIIKTYSDGMIGKWNSEIDTLLVYAGLFSAILTAFNVQSYQLLQPPAPNPTHAILERMSAQLRSFSVAAPYINSTEPHYTLATSPSESPAPTPAVVWLNILWFSGLICSLASASIGIMVKQWLREINMGPGLHVTPQEAAHIRQYRLNNLSKWRVAAIVSTLPVLLQLSLVLFLSGLLILLWTLHATVAAVSSALVGLLLIFMAATIVLPAIRDDCCYISPPTHAILSLAVGSRRLSLVAMRRALLSVHIIWTGLTGWTCKPLYDLTVSLLEMIKRGKSSTWSIREALSVDRQSRDLAVDQILLAYSLTLQSGYLSEWGRVCLMDRSRHDVGFVMRFIDGIRAIDTRHQALGFPNPPREVEDLEVWLYALLRLRVSKDGEREVDKPCILAFPEAALFKLYMTHAKAYISNSLFWGGAERCRPDALGRILRVLAPIAPMIMHDDMYRRLKMLVVRLSRRPQSLNTWNSAQYIAQITEELLQYPDRTRTGLLKEQYTSVDPIHVLVACAELKDTPPIVATRIRSLALDEVTHLLHLLHGTPGNAFIRKLNPEDIFYLALRLQEMHSLERRCRTFDGERDTPWMFETEPLPPRPTQWRLQWTPEDRQVAQAEIVKLCNRCIPSFRRPDLCILCRRNQLTLSTPPAQAI